MTSPRVSAARSMVALTRHRAADDPDLIEAKQEYAVLAIEEYVKRIVEAAPAFTESQRARIAALLGAHVTSG